MPTTMQPALPPPTRPTIHAVNHPQITSSHQGPLKQPVPGITRQWSWSRNWECGRPTSQTTYLFHQLSRSQLAGLLQPVIYLFLTSNISWRWLGHVARMDEVRIPKQALHWEVAGSKRRPGRPRMNWRDVVKKDLQGMGLIWEEVEASAQDRHSWRQRVALCIGDAGWIKVKVSDTALCSFIIIIIIINWFMKRHKQVYILSVISA